MRRALEYASGLGRRPGPALRGRGRRRRAAHMHEGEWSSRLGIPGQPAEAEELMVQRDIALARLTGARIHFQHLSTARSVELVRAARAAGIAGHRRGDAPPLHAHRRRAAPATTRCSRCNPPLRTDGRRRRRSGPGWPTAPSTPSPPTTPPTPRT